jgi:hypothetical protein
VAKKLQILQKPFAIIGANKLYKKWAVVITLVVFVCVIIIIAPRFTTVAIVADKKISRANVDRLDADGVNSEAKTKILADNYLYSAILSDVDPTYKEQNIRVYSGSLQRKISTDKKNSLYEEEHYFNRELKRRIQEYITGGFTGDFISVSYDKNFDSQDFQKINKDLRYGANLKDKLLKEVKNNKMSFQAIKNFLGDKNTAGGSEITLSEGTFSTLGAIDASNEQAEISTALHKNDRTFIFNDIYMVDIFESTSKGKFPGKLVIYKVDKYFNKNFRATLTFDKFIEQQKNKYGYEIL